MKKSYEHPNVILIQIVDDDIICSSSNFVPDDSGDDGEWI